jgi:hypothetical protein
MLLRCSWQALIFGSNGTRSTRPQFWKRKGAACPQSAPAPGVSQDVDDVKPDAMSMAKVDDAVERTGGHASGQIEHAVDGEVPRRARKTTSTVDNRGNLLNTDDTGLGS